MVKEFVTVKDDVITGVHSGDIKADFSGTEYVGHERIEIPRDAKIVTHDKLSFYNSNWERKPLIQLIDEGLVPIPEGFLREGDSLRRISPEERIINGLDAPPPGFKVEDGKIVKLSLVEKIAAGIEDLKPGFKIVDDTIVEMTAKEKIAAGILSQEDYNAQLSARKNAELQLRLAELQTPEALAQAEIDPEYAAEREAKLAALLAVKQQPGWPFTVEWPEE